VEQHTDGIRQLESPAVVRISRVEARGWLVPPEEVTEEGDRIRDSQDSIPVPVASHEDLAGARIRDAVPVPIRGRGGQRALEDEQTRGAWQGLVLQAHLVRGIALQVPESGRDLIAFNVPYLDLDPSTPIERQEPRLEEAKLVAAIAVQVDGG
jgi:hypothetical protein